MEYIKIGTKVTYRPAWGTEAPTTAKVIGIDKCVREGDKYGKKVKEIAWINKNYGCYDLDNGHWCYGSQIDNIVKRHKVILTHLTQKELLENGWATVVLIIYLNDVEVNHLKNCIREREVKNDSMTLALYDFTHSPYCTKHHKYKIWNTFEEGEINIKIED